MFVFHLAERVVLQYIAALAILELLACALNSFPSVHPPGIKSPFLNVLEVLPLLPPLSPDLSLSPPLPPPLSTPLPLLTPLSMSPPLPLLPPLLTGPSGALLTVVQEVLLGRCGGEWDRDSRWA